jgi:hypothetical protein
MQPALCIKAQGMEAWHVDVPSNIPSWPAARLVGHAGAIQAVTFTGENSWPKESFLEIHDEDILALGLMTQSHGTTN